MLLDAIIKLHEKIQDEKLRKTVDIFGPGHEVASA
jgi:hypothetical protein